MNKKKCFMTSPKGAEEYYKHQPDKEPLPVRLIITI